MIKSLGCCLQLAKLQDYASSFEAGVLQCYKVIKSFHSRANTIFVKNPFKSIDKSKIFVGNGGVVSSYKKQHTLR